VEDLFLKTVFAWKKLKFNFIKTANMVVVVLPDPFRGMGAWKNSTETQHSGHAPRFRPEVKIGRSSAKDSAPERLGCGTIQEEVNQIRQRVSAGAV